MYSAVPDSLNTKEGFSHLRRGCIVMITTFRCKWSITGDLMLVKTVEFGSSAMISCDPANAYTTVTSRHIHQGSFMGSATLQRPFKWLPNLDGVGYNRLYC